MTPPPETILTARPWAIWYRRGPRFAWAAVALAEDEAAAQVRQGELLSVLPSGDWHVAPIRGDPPLLTPIEALTGHRLPAAARG
jgi:hypothetical protein